jgi:IclR family pca regulon transcriptional regulator
MSQNRDIATTFAKGLAVLGAFDGTAPTLTLAEIARRTGLDRATARRLVLTLSAEGFVRQTGTGFALTPRVLALAGGFLQAGGFGLRVQPLLDRYAERLGHAVTLGCLDRMRVLLVAQSTFAESPVSFGFTLGSGLPLLHTSLGRMLLAQMPPDAAQALIDAAPMARHTTQSATDRTAIAARVADARREGFCLADQEFEPGILGLSVPVGGHAALGLSCPRGLSDPSQIAESMLPGLQACAADLAQKTDLSHLAPT